MKYRRMPKKADSIIPRLYIIEFFFLPRRVFKSSCVAQKFFHFTPD
jgi:hypothetical protein